MRLFVLWGNIFDISKQVDFILTVLTPLGLRLLPPIFAATGLLEIAASGTGLEQTVQMNSVEKMQPKYVWCEGLRVLDKNPVDFPD